MDVFKDPIVFVTICTLVGLFVGSFLNVVIHRLPVMMEREWHLEAASLRGDTPEEAAPRFNLAVPRSRCPHCGHLIGALENIPVVSYILLRGRCRHCSGPIGVRYPLIEILCAGLSGFTALHFGFGAAGCGALVFVWAMIALCFIDLDTQLLPDSITLPLLWLGLLLNLNATYTNLADAVVGAAAGYLTLWSVFWLFKLATGKEGMGYGDFKLLAAIGAWLGWQILPLTILLSSLVGAIVGISLILLRKHGREIPIPFGPYLAAAGLLALYWGTPLTQAYLGTL
ncbi:MULTISPECIES: A24 family peptidase [Zoogloea]|jgi:leader peptidase (prepilin peptidase)/N-methyltransferase|uniref:Prepilin leader peptidase/N-methyltransferase n=1 Tax=Zoogloea oleivorans TaxID=1552750 RepID=A0A6C2CMT5_9RHOO|nr:MULTISPECIES: A24 family peptidase [Zoogloea]MBT9498949.1 prepilin peptidase [Zoogloea sp.]MDD2667270.1 A24 family peptidase [Zoogloea sp.]MDY0035609.1 A24 family peptidase [Zoogloea oleivorans]TYC54662.1 prepilin peptidase [Zoogloea oleivorans]